MNSLYFKYDLSRVGMDMRYAQTTSKNSLPFSPYSFFRQTGGLPAAVPINTIPDSLKKDVLYYGPEKSLLSSISLFSSLYTEKNQTLSADFRFPIGIGSNLVGYLKIGGQYRYQKNNNDQETPYATIHTGSDIQDLIMEAIVDHFGVPYDSTYGKFAATEFMGDPEFVRERVSTIRKYVLPHLSRLKPAQKIHILSRLNYFTRFLDLGGDSTAHRRARWILLRSPYWWLNVIRYINKKWFGKKKQKELEDAIFSRES